MPTAVVTLPDGRRARLTGPTREAVMEKASKLTQLGTDPSTGHRDPSLATIDEAMLGLPGRSNATRPYEFTLPLLGTRVKVGGRVADVARAASNVDDKTSTPIVLGTMGALATGGTSLVPSVLGAGFGGGAGGALAESRDPNATPGSIAGAALRSGATMAATEAGGFGLGALANRMIAPNLGRYADPMRGVRESVAATGLAGHLRGGLSQLTRHLPSRLQHGGRFAASPLGGELLEATAIPAAMALGGPMVAIPLWLARAAFAPSVLQRYLSRSGLPNEAVRTLGREGATTAIRYPMLEDSQR